MAAIAQVRPNGLCQITFRYATVQMQVRVWQRTGTGSIQPTNATVDMLAPITQSAATSQSTTTTQTPAIFKLPWSQAGQMFQCSPAYNVTNSFFWKLGPIAGSSDCADRSRSLDATPRGWWQSQIGTNTMTPQRSTLCAIEVFLADTVRVTARVVQANGAAWTQGGTFSFQSTGRTLDTAIPTTTGSATWDRTTTLPVATLRQIYDAAATPWNMAALLPNSVLSQGYYVASAAATCTEATVQGSSVQLVQLPLVTNGSNGCAITFTVNQTNKTIRIFGEAFVLGPNDVHTTTAAAGAGPLRVTLYGYPANGAPSVTVQTVPIGSTGATFPILNPAFRYEAVVELLSPGADQSTSPALPYQYAEAWRLSCTNAITPSGCSEVPPASGQPQRAVLPIPVFSGAGTQVQAVRGRFYVKKRATTPPPPCDLSKPPSVPGGCQVNATVQLILHSRHDATGQFIQTPAGQYSVSFPAGETMFVTPKVRITEPAGINGYTYKTTVTEWTFSRTGTTSARDSAGACRPGHQTGPSSGTVTGCRYRYLVTPNADTAYPDDVLTASDVAEMLPLLYTAFPINQQDQIPATYVIQRPGLEPTDLVLSVRLSTVVQYTDPLTGAVRTLPGALVQDREVTFRVNVVAPRSTSQTAP